MNLEDARKLTPEAQQALRQRAVAAVVDGGRSQGEVAQEFGVTRTAVNQWVQRYRAQGERSLVARKQGRPNHPTLGSHQVSAITRLIKDCCPEQLQLPFALWTRQAVALLIEQRCGVRLERTTVGRYLRRWGLSPQKPRTRVANYFATVSCPPATRARQQSPDTVQKWLETQYPALRQRAHLQGAEIHWGDEMGLRSDHQSGTCWASKGQTPVVEGSGQRFGCNLISTLTNRGTLRFQVFEGSFTTEVFLGFLRRLVRAAHHKVFLVVDRHPVHRAYRVTEWVAQHSQQLELFYLPPYSPERNPDEFLNQDVKTNALGCQRPHNKAELMQIVRAYLHRIQQWPERVSRYFWAPEVKYAGL